MSSVFQSTLHDETTFYKSFIRDLERCSKEVIIESPYITENRTRVLLPALKDLANNGVKVYVLTRDPKEHEENRRSAEEFRANVDKLIAQLEELKDS